MSVFDLYIANALERSRVSRELIALYVHRILTASGNALSGVFTVVFIYQYFGNSLWAALYAYAAIYLGTVLATPISARLLRSLGTRRLLLLALPCMAAGVWELYLVQTHTGEPYVTGVAAFIALAILYRALYWVPYHVDAAQLLDRSFLGMQYAVFESIGDAALAALPFIGGVVVAAFGFGALFLSSATLFLVAGVPLLWVTNRYERYEWGLGETFRQLFSHRNRSLLVACVGDGMQTCAELVVWPLLAFLLLDGEYVALGAVAALTLMVVFVLRFLTGRFFDRGGKSAVLSWGAWLSSSGWILRMFAATPFSVIAVNTYYGFGQAVSNTSVGVFYYEQAADNGRYVDEYTALKEIALGLGRALMLVIVGISAWFFGEYVGFAVGLFVAAFAALATTWLAKSVSLR